VDDSLDDLTDWPARLIEADIPFQLRRAARRGRVVRRGLAALHVNVAKQWAERLIHLDGRIGAHLPGVDYVPGEEEFTRRTQPFGKVMELFGRRQETVKVLVLDGWCEPRLENLLDRLTIDVPDPGMPIFEHTHTVFGDRGTRHPAGDQTDIPRTQH